MKFWSTALPLSLLLVLAGCASTGSETDSGGTDSATDTSDEAPAKIRSRDDLPEVTEEGLVLVHDSELAIVYVDPEADLSGYTEVMMKEVYIAFRKNWQRDQNRSSPGIRITDNDMQRIRDRLSEEFISVFTEVLEEDNGFPVVDQPGESVLLLRPAIIDLNPTAPDTMSAGRTRTWSESSGSMTLYMEVYDSITGDLLAKALDPQADRSSGWMTWQTSVTNSQAARRILRGWAQPLRDALDEAHPNRSN